ncbi:MULTISPECIES: amidase [unclassified Azospirillum]|uniref:amidase n=1 Tax=unclassified Azospirillum TaxID=2630922 RepID=UPI000B758DF1|nr:MULTISPECIES: amidase [unclassified Azospirillum]SNS76655.1 amidase [Azospirillum sp. RU38E]SNS93849.1 amidase [Azospirillum sp. RU37A]
MQGEHLWQWEAGALAEAIRQRRVSAREAVESCLARIAQVNPVINALTEIQEQAALAAADKADQAVAAGGDLPPLHGVPATVKINVDQAGSATTNGVAPLVGLIAPVDSPPVANWRDAGTIFLGRSNAPAFSCRWFTDNAPHGRTLNPWNPGLNVGGSSGGAAAATATGMAPLAHCNDLAGSARLPAAACGVYGLRPTVGRVPAFNATAKAERSLCLQFGSAQGVIARSVGDIRLGLHSMARRDARDPAWVPAPLEQPDDAAPVRVALFTGEGEHRPDSHTAAALRQAADTLADAGYEVVEAAPPRFIETAELWMALLSNDCRTPAARAAFSMGDADFLHSLELTAACVPEMSPADMLAALSARTGLLREWQLFLETYPLLLMPTAWTAAFPVGHDIAGEREARELLVAHSPCTSTACVSVPALSIPFRPTGSPLPVGIQLVAGRFREGRILAAAQAMASRLPPVSPIDPVTA